MSVCVSVCVESERERGKKREQSVLRSMMRNSNLLSEEMRCKKIESMNKMTSVPHSSLC